MTAITLGPLVLPGDRFALLAALVLFLVITGVLAARISPRFNGWSTVVALGALAAARLGHVIENAGHFAETPWRALAIWQGGFSWIWTAPVVIVATVLMLPMRRERLWALVPLLAAGVVGATLLHRAETTPPIAPPALALISLDDTAVDLERLAGQPTVINLWASWCAPCRREMPTLQAAQAAHPEVRFLYINQREPEAVIRAWMADEGLGLGPVLRDPYGAVADHYGAVGLPATLFLDADGRLRAAHLGEISPEELARQVARITPAVRD